MNHRNKAVGLYALVGIFVAIRAANLSAKASAVTQECPVRFGEFPQVTSSPTLSSVKLTGNGLAAVQVLAPRSEGFSVLRVEDKGVEAIYGSYTVQKTPETKLLFLSMGMGGLDWSTASDAPGKDISTVRPGFFRIELRYLSPLTLRGSVRKVCVAISPTFELTEEFQLLTTE